MNPPAWLDRIGPALRDSLSPALWPERVRAWLATEASGRGPWCVALSGGADSVALLLTLCGLRNADCGMRIVRGAVLQPEPADIAEPQQLGLKRCGTPETDGGVASLGPPHGRPAQPAAPSLLALHFNHRLRGAASEGDEDFCRELCAALGVELQVGTAEWPRGSAVSEARAREARFAFFDRAMSGVGSRALWLGHQRDDVIETLLLRLSRGSGSRGLAAPRPVQRLADGSVRLRPLLGFSKAEIVATLRGAGVPWREDESNHGDAYFRNRLRGQVIPAWAAAAPEDLGAAVARARGLLEEEDEALEAWVDRVVSPQLGPELPLAPLHSVPIAVARRALHRWLLARGAGEVLSRTAFDELLRAVRARQPFRASAGAAGFVEVDAACARLVGATTAPEAWVGGTLAVPGEMRLPDGGRLDAELRSVDEVLRRRIQAGEFAPDRCVFLGLENATAFPIRQWQAGDRYRPLGAARATKLQNQFVNRRIPHEWRHRLPVVCDSAGSILWVPGLPPADSARVGSGTAVAVQLTYLPANSLSASTGHV